MVSVSQRRNNGHPSTWLCVKLKFGCGPIEVPAVGNVKELSDDLGMERRGLRKKKGQLSSGPPRMPGGYSYWAEEGLMLRVTPPAPRHLRHMDNLPEILASQTQGT
ncbi:hypothetical protein chiPu_0018878 [Chiloscyllium punctatum]|uniref:Uncharacterized protein n=1 Tax=Chiloscyllium punctatum TaxID=137246 RepID=A0A401RQ31_CHIPU|nr:hypothetical protein [Chiloscyllium punctatum]